MFNSKMQTLKPLFNSVDGVHVSIYLVNRGDVFDLMEQLREAIDQADEFLTPVMKTVERKAFLEPLNFLLIDTRILSQMKGNIGIFRNKDFLRVLKVPVEVEQSCQIATSFHVKPLMRWLQSDQEFLFLGLEQNTAHLYFGSMDSLRLVDSKSFSEKNRHHDSMEIDRAAWLDDCLAEIAQTTKPKLFLAGESSLVESVRSNINYKNTIRTPISHSFNKTEAKECVLRIRKLLDAESRAWIEKALLEFRFADEDRRTRKNIFEISKAVVQGRVKKLIISDELNIYGKIDQKTGGLALHPFALDHEDDDILDDLAQMVLRQGGEVIVASKSEIPKGRPILALIEGDGIPKVKTEYYRGYSDCSEHNVLQERFG